MKPINLHLPASTRWPTLRWPLPAVAGWTLAWLAFIGTRGVGLDHALAWLASAALGALVATRVAGRWRQALVAVGFPLSSLALGVAAPAWLWLLATVPLLLAYPIKAWSDAPFFPTPPHALQALAAAVPLAAAARVIDAGCGLGHGLRALHATWPDARIEGVEWSALLAWLCARRCGFATVRRGDLWQHGWQGCDLVYLFQRPESMPRAWAKASAEMAPGRWLVSLEFAVPGVEPWRRLDAGGGRPLWVYRVGSKNATDGR